MKIELIIDHCLLQGHAPLGSERSFQLPKVHNWTKTRRRNIFPLNKNEVLNSIFVHELSEEERRRYQGRQKRNENRLIISGQIITKSEKILEIADRIKDVDKFSYLCQIDDSRRKSYLDIVKEIISIQLNDCKLLSNLPKLPAGYYSYE